MRYRLVVEGDFLYAELFGTKTTQELRAFLRALRLKQKTFGGTRILLSVRQSVPLFRTNGGTSIFVDFAAIARDDSYRIAVVADTHDLRLSYEYLAGLAGRRHINLRSFSSEVSARRWLDERRAGDDRRTPVQAAIGEQGGKVDADSRRWERRKFVVVRGEY